MVTIMKNRMHIPWAQLPCVLYFLAAFTLSAAVHGANAATADEDTIERGKYLVRTSGCNDCHTPGYLLSEGSAPEALWLTGDSFGWHGPWGTTYATNLRLLISTLSENEWLLHAKTLKVRPPMPWFNLNMMHDEDLRAIYQYVRHLGPAGEPSPSYLPPDIEPPPPFATFPAPPPNR
jgi:mono/diheme cytochrome c family protein